MKKIEYYDFDNLSFFKKIKMIRHIPSMCNLENNKNRIIESLFVNQAIRNKFKFPIKWLKNKSSIEKVLWNDASYFIDLKDDENLLYYIVNYFDYKSQQPTPIVSIDDTKVFIDLINVISKTRLDCTSFILNDTYIITQILPCEFCSYNIPIHSIYVDNFTEYKFVNGYFGCYPEYIMSKVLIRNPENIMILFKKSKDLNNFRIREMIRFLPDDKKLDCLRECLYPLPIENLHGIQNLLMLSIENIFKTSNDPYNIIHRIILVILNKYSYSIHIKWLVDKIIDKFHDYVDEEFLITSVRYSNNQ